MKNSVRKPDLRLVVKYADGTTGRVGAGWTNPQGHTNVKLNAGVVLSERELEGGLLTLFPADSPEGSE